MPADDDRAALNRYVRERLQREAREHGRGYQADMSRRTGLSQAHIANIMNRDYQGVGLEATGAFGRAWGMTSSELIETARSGAAPTKREDPPNLEAALAFLRSRGHLDDLVIDAARRIAAASRDFSVATWIVILSDLATELPTAAPQSARRP